MERISLDLINKQKAHIQFDLKDELWLFHTVCVQCVLDYFQPYGTLNGFLFPLGTNHLLLSDELPQLFFHLPENYFVIQSSILVK